MRRSIAVPLWDLFLVATMLLPLPLMVALVNGRTDAALWYAGSWLVLAVVATIVGRWRGVSLKTYLDHI